MAMAIGHLTREVSCIDWYLLNLLATPNIRSNILNWIFTHRHKRTLRSTLGLKCRCDCYRIRFQFVPTPAAINSPAFKLNRMREMCVLQTNRPHQNSHHFHCHSHCRPKITSDRRCIELCCCCIMQMCWRACNHFAASLIYTIVSTCSRHRTRIVWHYRAKTTDSLTRSHSLRFHLAALSHAGRFCTAKWIHCCHCKRDRTAHCREIPKAIIYAP